MKVGNISIPILATLVTGIVGCSESVKKHDGANDIQPDAEKSDIGVAGSMADGALSEPRDVTYANDAFDSASDNRGDARTDGDAFDSASVDRADAGLADDAMDGSFAFIGDAGDDGVECGPRRCGEGEICCNTSCGICVSPNERCSNVVCRDAASVDAVPFEDMVDGCPEYCTAIYGSPEGRQRYCLDRDAGQFLLGCSCDPLPNINPGCLYHEATDTLYYSFDTGGLESTPGWRDCGDDDWRRVMTACVYQECESRMNNTCTLDELCNNQGCGAGGPFDQAGCRVPVCQSDKDCAATERCAWNDCQTPPGRCEYDIELERCVCPSIDMCTRGGYCIPRSQIESSGYYGPDKAACSPRATAPPYDIAFDFETGVQRECLIGSASRGTEYQGKYSLLGPIMEKFEEGSTQSLELTFVVDDSQFAPDDPQRYEAQCCAIQHALSLGVEYLGSTSDPNAFTARISMVDQFVPLAFRRDVISLISDDVVPES